MPLPNKRKGEKRSDFVSRCVSRESKNSGKSTEQILAICNSQFERSRADEIIKELADAVEANRIVGEAKHGQRLSLLRGRREIP